MSDRISGSGDSAFDAFRAFNRQSSDRSPGGAGSGLARTFQEHAAAMRAEHGAAATNGPERAANSSLAGAVEQGIGIINNELQVADRLPQDILTGEVSGPAEIAARLKRADLTLKYSLEIRNRLVDAYREVMRMSV